MLSAVLLHVIEAARPIDAAGDFAQRNRSIQDVGRCDPLRRSPRSHWRRRWTRYRTAGRLMSDRTRYGRDTRGGRRRRFRRRARETPAGSSPGSKGVPSLRRRCDLHLGANELPVRQFVDAQLSGSASGNVLDFLRPQCRNLGFELRDRRIFRLGRRGHQPDLQREIADVRFRMIDDREFDIQLTRRGFRDSVAGEFQIFGQRMLAE